MLRIGEDEIVAQTIANLKNILFMVADKCVISRFFHIIKNNN